MISPLRSIVREHYYGKFMTVAISGRKVYNQCSNKWLMNYHFVTREVRVRWMSESESRLGPYPLRLKGIKFCNSPSHVYWETLLICFSWSEILSLRHRDYWHTSTWRIWTLVFFCVCSFVGAVTRCASGWCVTLVTWRWGERPRSSWRSDWTRLSYCKLR